MSDLKPMQRTQDILPFDEFTPGQTCLIQAIEGPALLVERLYEMGFLPGESLRFLGRLPFKGPWLVEVRSVAVALRENEVRCLRL